MIIIFSTLNIKMANIIQEIIIIHNSLIKQLDKLEQNDKTNKKEKKKNRKVIKKLIMIIIIVIMKLIN